MTRTRRRPRRTRRHPAVEQLLAVLERPLVRMLVIALAPAGGLAALSTGQLMQAHQEIAAVRDTVQAVHDSAAVRDSASWATARRDRGRVRKTVDSLAVVVRDQDYRIYRLERSLDEARAWQIGPVPPRKGRSGPP